MKWNETLELENGNRLDYWQHDNGMYHGEIKDSNNEVVAGTVTTTMNDLWRWVDERKE